MDVIGSVAELRRYPVKSLAGEVLPRAEVDRRGVRADRLWAVTDPDGKLGSGKSSRRFRRMEGLLELSAVHGGGLAPVIAFPDGRRMSGTDPRVDEALSDHVGRPVRLRREGTMPHFDAGPLHVLTTASIAAVARAHGGTVPTARLRPNLVLDVPGPGLAEDGWVGRTLAVGPDLLVRVGERVPRCVMVDMAQAGLPAAAGLLATIGRLNDAMLGVVADIVTPGVVTVGDQVRLVA